MNNDAGFIIKGHTSFDGDVEGYQNVKFAEPF